MVRNFRRWLPGLRPGSGSSVSLRDPRVAVRLMLGVLFLANLVAAWFVFNPLGGSVEDLDRQAITLQRQITERRAATASLKTIAGKVTRAKSEGEAFMTQHFLDRRTAYSTLIVEMESAAKTGGVKARDHSFNYEPIEGSDTLGLLTVNANYEGTYADLMQFINQVDRTKRLFILETLQAQPQQGATTLLITLKMITFVREDGSEVASPAAPAPPPGSTPAPAAERGRS